jgi:hypothetical protein
MITMYVSKRKDFSKFSLSIVKNCMSLIIFILEIFILDSPYDQKRLYTTFLSVVFLRIQSQRHTTVILTREDPQLSDAVRLDIVSTGNYL